MMKDEYLYKLGFRIAELRLKKGLSQEDLGFEVGKSTTSLSNIECGKTNVKVLTLKDIARGLDVELYKLLTEAEYTPAMYSPTVKRIVDKINHQDEKILKVIEDQINLILGLKKGKF